MDEDAQGSCMDPEVSTRKTISVGFLLFIVLLYISINHPSAQQYIKRESLPDPRALMNPGY